jgi:hypothetical protein
VALCLWLGDNIVILSMVKRAQYSNKLCDCTNEMTQTCIYTNLGTCLGPTSYSGSSNLLYYFCGPTSLPGNYISTLLLFPVGRLLFCGLLFHFILFWGVLQLFNGLPLTSWNLLLL